VNFFSKQHSTSSANKENWCLNLVHRQNLFSTSLDSNLSWCSENFFEELAFFFLRLCGATLFLTWWQCRKQLSETTSQVLKFCCRTFIWQQPLLFIQSWDNNVKLELEMLKQFGPTAVAIVKRCKKSVNYAAAWLSPFGAEISLEYLVHAVFL